MLNSKHILVVNDHGPSYAKPFKHLGLPISHDPGILRQPDSVALVVFTGGEDVSPSLYGTTNHHTTSNSIRRDMMEVGVFNQARSLNLPVAGICRGAQFLCVMAGGRLIQDVTGHCSGGHQLLATYPTGVTKSIHVTSSHHQMQYPFDLPANKYVILAQMEKPLSRHYAFSDEVIIEGERATEKMKLEPDVVWYPGIQALAAQYHPEWMAEDSDGFRYFQELVNHYLVPRITGLEDELRFRQRTA